jgi:hypothetical protein
VAEVKSCVIVVDEIEVVDDEEDDTAIEIELNPEDDVDGAILEVC